MNKLLNITLRYYGIFFIAVLLLSAPAFYIIIRNLLIEDVDEALEVQRDDFKNFTLPRIVETEIDSWNNLHRDIKIIPPTRRLKREIIYDDSFLEKDHHHVEMEPYRVLLSPITIQNNPYHLQIKMSLVESEDLVERIFAIYSAMIILVMIGLLLITRYLSKKLWTPFYDTVKVIENIELDKATAIQLTDSNVDEFRKLNQSLQKLLDKNSVIFKSQKEFTENASHEIQTPLAVFQSKIDMLMQTPGLTAEQFQLISDLASTAQRLGRLNRNLLLLSKIDNDQFSKSDDVDAAAIIETTIETLQPLADVQRICIKKEISAINIRANKILFEILINNLISNAIRHNQADGTIWIFLDNHSITIRNTGHALSISKEKLFERFGKGDRNPHSTGLGLAIVKKISDALGYTIDYTTEKEVHQFRLRF